MIAARRISPTNRGHKSRLGGVQAQGSGTHHRSGARLCIGIGRIVGGPVEGKAGSRSHVGGRGELVLVLEQHPGANAEPGTEGIQVGLNAGLASAAIPLLVKVVE